MRATHDKDAETGIGFNPCSLLYWFMAIAICCSVVFRQCFPGKAIDSAGTCWPDAFMKANSKNGSKR